MAERRRRLTLNWPSLNSRICAAKLLTRDEAQRVASPRAGELIS